MATYMGRDTSKLKAKGGKWKYMTEQEMLSIASRFSPYRCVYLRPLLLRFRSCCGLFPLLHRAVLGRLLQHRSLFMWYMWRIEDVDISVMQSG